MKVRRVWAAGFVIASLCVVGRMEVSAEDSSLSEKQTVEAEEMKVSEPEAESVTQEEKSEQEEAPKEETQEIVDRTLEESLMMTRAEADFFLQKLIELARRNEALGIDALTDDQHAMNEKFVKLAGELNRSEKKKSALEEALKRLIEAHEALEKGGDDARNTAAREKYQVALREASEILKGKIVCPVKTAKSISDAVVLDVDGSGKIIVVNAGKFQGMRVGMTFYLVRVGEVIGECQVMEVREYLSAALCKNREKEESVQLGDRLIPAVTK